MPTEPNKPNPRVSILIVTWNSAGTVRDCLGSIRDQVPEGTCEVVLVDNAGPDDTAEIVAQEFPWVRLVRNERNVGFARAVNLAAARARGEYLLLLNPDAVLENDAVSLLADFLESDPKAGAASPDIRDSQGGRSLAAVQARPTLGAQFRRQFGLAKLFGTRQWKLGPDPVQADRLSGSALMVPARVWQKVGPLDQMLPLYFEDLDFSARIDRFGLGLWRVPRAVVTHAGEFSAQAHPRRGMLLAMENGQAPWMYFNLYQGRSAASLFSLIIFCGSLFRLVLAATLGWTALLRGQRGALWRRRISREAGALLGWAWGSKKFFLAWVQERFYGDRPGQKQDPDPEAAGEE